MARHCTFSRDSVTDWRPVPPPTADRRIVVVALRQLSLDALSSIGYKTEMVEVRQTEEFSAWLHRLKDANAVARIVARIRRLEQGNPGDSKSVGQGLLEMRVDYGPGYRIYYLPRGTHIVILLCGGDKRTQQQDIKRARKLAESL